MKSGIYAIKNNRNGKIYIGQSVNLRKRKASHFSYLNNQKHRNEYLQRAFNADRDAFEFIVIEHCDIEKLNEREVFWIDTYKSMDEFYGYNLESGGKACFVKSEETRRKMREAAKGKTIPMEVRAKMSRAAKGRIVSEETRRKNAEASRGRVKTPEEREKHRLAWLGRRHTEEAKLKMSLGALAWRRGRLVQRLCLEVGCQ